MSMIGSTGRVLFTETYQPPLQHLRQGPAPPNQVSQVRQICWIGSIMANNYLARGSVAGISTTRFSYYQTFLLNEVCYSRRLPWHIREMKVRVG